MPLTSGPVSGRSALHTMRATPNFHDGGARGSHRVISADRDHSIYRPEMIDRHGIAYSDAKVVLNR